MHISDRFDLSQTDRARLDDFEDYIWFNSELCNNCFSQVREIGDEMIRHSDCHRHYINAYYERTETGTREYHPWLQPTRRYGETFCDECGGDLEATGDDLSFEELQERAVRVYKYTKEHTPLALDHAGFGRRLGTLKRRPDLQNCDWQILAVAWVRSITDAPRPDDADAAVPAD